MLKDESNTQRNNNVNVNKTPSSNNNNNVNEIQQQTKDRTLFCINIDQKCTEDILYELFLQVLVLLIIKNFKIFITFYKLIIGWSN